jgi:hypothetical protein
MSAHANDTPLRTLVQSRVDADTKLDPAAGLLVLAALAGEPALRDALADAQTALAEARKTRDKAAKDAKAQARDLCARLKEIPDDRAEKARTLLEAKTWDLAFRDGDGWTLVELKTGADAGGAPAQEQARLYGRRSSRRRAGR